MRAHVTWLSLLLLGACACGGGPDKDPTQVTGFMVKGVAQDRAGNPLAGVRVDAHDSLDSLSYVSALTDANGAYNIRLDPDRITSYYVVAEMDVSWDGQDWTFALEPENPNRFQADEGGIRNFTWEIEGETEVGVLFHGGQVFVASDIYADSLIPENIEVDFEPIGPRIDGSAGQPFTMALAASSTRLGVALGTYRVSARDVTDPSLPVVVRLYDDEGAAYTESLEAGFVSKSHSGTLNLSVSVAD